jgi:hypothetical protein
MRTWTATIETCRYEGAQLAEEGIVCQKGTSKWEQAREWRKRSDEQIERRCLYVRVTCIPRNEATPPAASAAWEIEIRWKVLIWPLFLPHAY